MDELKPSISVAIKLASLFVHVKESLSANGHPMDSYAIKSILDDSEVKEYITILDKKALVPKIR